MEIQWLQLIISAVVTLLSVGGLGWILTAKEDKKSKQLDNTRKEDEIAERKKNEVLEDWRELCSVYKSQAEEANARLADKDLRIREKDDIISDLRTKLDERNTALAVSELLKCHDIQCPNRKPSFASSIINVDASIKDFIGKSNVNK